MVKSHYDNNVKVYKTSGELNNEYKNELNKVYGITFYRVLSTDSEDKNSLYSDKLTVQVSKDNKVVSCINSTVDKNDGVMYVILLCNGAEPERIKNK